MTWPWNDDGWMSPEFGPIGCLGAVLFFIVMVAGIFGLLYMAWWPLLHPR